MSFALPEAAADVIELAVGLKERYSTIPATVDYADQHPQSYYDIRVDPGTYSQDFPTVSVPIMIENAGSAPVVLQLTSPPANFKGIITTSGAASLTVRGLTFVGAQTRAGDGSNGAGIRDQSTGGTLTVLDSVFRGNQDGILTDSNPTGSVAISGSKFFDNGVQECPSGGCDHALYVGQASSLGVTDSLFCGTLTGHDIKSRATSTTIQRNTLLDGAADASLGCSAGTTSYAVDLPNAGHADISNNVLIQGPASENNTLVAYGEEGAYGGSSNSLAVENNTFQNNDANGSPIVDGSIGTRNFSDVPAAVIGNTFQGFTPDRRLVGPGVVVDEPIVAVDEPGNSWIFLCTLSLMGLRAMLKRRRFSGYIAT